MVSVSSPLRLGVADSNDLVVWSRRASDLRFSEMKGQQTRATSWKSEILLPYLCLQRCPEYVGEPRSTVLKAAFFAPVKAGDIGGDASACPVGLTVLHNFQTVSGVMPRVTLHSPCIVISDTVCRTFSALVASTQSAC